MKYMAHYHHDLCEGSDGGDVCVSGERRRGSNRANRGVGDRDENLAKRILGRERKSHEGSSRRKFVTKTGSYKCAHTMKMTGEGRKTSWNTQKHLKTSHDLYGTLHIP